MRPAVGIERRYADYETQTRQEYEHVPSFIFRHKRKAILRSFLERPSISSTSLFRERLEGAARTNLDRADVQEASLLGLRAFRA